MSLQQKLFPVENHLAEVSTPDFPTAAKRSGGIFGGWVDCGVAPAAYILGAIPPDPSASMTSLGKSVNSIFRSRTDVR